MHGITKCLAANIRQLREQKGLTQTELADRAGLSAIFLQGIESERKWVSPRSARALARALRVPESRLFENCFERSDRLKRPRRLRRPTFDHVPTDIYNALATTCRIKEWQWDAIRWLIQGFENQQKMIVPGEKGEA